jgi:hypothetical protein
VFFILSHLWQDSPRGTVSQPSSPKDARWNADRQTVEFGVEIGEYHGTVRVPRCVFQRLRQERPTPEASRRTISSEPSSKALPNGSSAAAS